MDDPLDLDAIDVRHYEKGGLCARDTESWPCEKHQLVRRVRELESDARRGCDWCGRPMDKDAYEHGETCCGQCEDAMAGP